MQKICVSILVLFSFGNVSSQKAQLHATKEKKIFYSRPHLPLVEPHLAVNPKNPNHMVVAAIVFDSTETSESRTHIVVFATRDNGMTWKQTDLNMNVGFDPWVAIRDDNMVGLVTMAGYDGGHRTGLIYYFSGNGGFSWSPADTINFGGGHDHATMISDPATSRLFILSSLTKRDSLKQMHTYAWLNNSHDWKTFQKPPSIFHIGQVNSNTLTINFNSPDHLFIPYVEYSVNNNLPGSPVFKYLHSSDAKKMSGPYMITARGGLAKGFAVSATDLTGKYKGRTYFVKNTGTTPIRSHGLYLHFQDSIGSNWSEEIRIDHNDAPEKLLRTAAIAVNKDGVVGIVWVDRRNDPELKQNDIYFTASIDGGKTFLQEIRITQQSSDPKSSQNGKAGERFISGGDYIGCVAKPDGSFQIVWADNRGNVFQLYTSNIRVSMP